VILPLKRQPQKRRRPSKGFIFGKNMTKSPKKLKKSSQRAIKISPKIKKRPQRNQSSAFSAFFEDFLPPPKRFFWMRATI
jgi:hypothetical protein